MINNRKKVFISYSWVPEENKQWVEKLAKKLENDGIEVVIDYKNLKLGHDKYMFMEKMVNDSSIDKVLIICNSEYKKKADARIGGVGDEAIIITPQVYRQAEQEKFIPVVCEKDANGEPYLPIYLASRMYADLTNFSEGYKNLLENLTGNSESQTNFGTAYINKNEVKNNEKYIEEYVNICIEIIKEPRIIFSKSFVDKLIEKQIALYKLNNQVLIKLTGEFCKGIQNRLNAFDEESAKSLWNISDRMHEIMEEGLVECGEIIDQVEFETQEHIKNEVIAYQLGNIVDDNMVREHIDDIYTCINGELTSTSELSNRYVKAKELDKKVVLNLEKQKTNVSESNGVQDLRLFFKNVTDNQATSINIMPSENLVKGMEGTVWGKNQESKAGVIITKYEAMIGDINVDENGEFQYMLRYKTYNNHFFLVCFCVEIRSIYGIKTEQLFNIVIINGTINQVFIETEY
ncbi:toll/interleukin-1 receptor domain-containing protein [Roseburia inulinivorans]|uniref:toll/interleukin-1 receptor domain-containing protein n=1 Tax=Roseburia inulinivorans TaxID=360807 RepID=UPI00266D051B|nr:toll/interleukin-1 receptor domain-containing protein [Roseburia inulinivorans]